MKTTTNLTPSTPSLEGETRSKLLSTQRLTRVRVFHNVTTLTIDTRQIIKEQITTLRPYEHQLLTLGNDGKKIPKLIPKIYLSSLREERIHKTAGRMAKSICNDNLSQVKW